MSRRVFAIASTVAAVVALSGLTACGRTNEKARAAGIMPSDAIAFVSFNLSPSIEQKTNLQSILSKFPYEHAKDSVQSQLDRALANAVKQGGLDYKTDVKPWLGNEVAVGVLSGSPPKVVVLIESKDDSKAKAALEKAKKQPDAGFSYRFVKSFAVLTDEKDTAALDTVAKVTKTSDSLAGQAKFTRVEEALHGDRLFLGWVDGKKGIDAIKATARAPIPITTDQILQGSDGIAGFDLHARNSAAVIEAVAKATTTSVKAGAPRITDGLPGGSLGAVTIFDLSSAFNEAVKGFGAIPGFGSPQQIEQQFQQMTGLNLQTDLLSWMHGEAVLVAGPGAGAGPIPDFALVVAPSDQAAAQAGVGKLKAALTRTGLKLVDRQVEGATASVVPQPLFGGIQPAFALFPDRFVLASSPGYLGALAKASSAGLATTEEFKHAVGSSSASTNIQIFLRIAPIRDAIVKTLSAGERSFYEQQVAKFVQPFEALSVRAFHDGSLQRFEAKVTFK